MNITIIGTGYVGLTAAICFANAGHKVICIDKDPLKIDLLQAKKSPIYEKNMEELLCKAIDDGNIEFSTNLKYGVNNSIINILAVGTPQDENSGQANLSYIMAASKEMAQYINEYKLIIIKSTVPIGTNHEVKKIIEDNSGQKIDIASNPEFMREGFAIEDFMQPDRIVAGIENKKSQELIEELYKNWLKYDFPILFTDIKTAELIKYSSNAFLMTKIAFINEISNLCEASDCNITDLIKAMGMDHRIGAKFLNPGPGIGGSCFPKDSLALSHIGKKYQQNLSILDQVIRSNNQRFIDMAEKIKKITDSNKKIAILGLAFKSGTDDVRMSPAIEIIKHLLKDNYQITAFDPEAIKTSQKILGNQISYAKNIAECYNSAKYIIILTEWPEFKEIKNYQDFNQKKIIDLRNII
ncbi:UDP-glucose/GDP-mannose dehydrogenase family protein [Rickettsiales bacterium]|nr:UDP-glucose/GDP-mannose dehydrogenase family protein [Rickettsiales bacterium]